MNNPNQPDLPVHFLRFRQEPAPATNFSPQPGTLFNDAVLRLGQMDLNEFRGLRHWSDALPYPPFETSEMVTRRRLFGRPVGMPPSSADPSIALQLVEWEKDAAPFFLKAQQRIQEKFDWVMSLAARGIRQWENKNYRVELSAESVAYRWFQSQESYTVAYVFELTISEGVIFAFVKEQIAEFLGVIGLGTSQKKKDIRPFPQLLSNRFSERDLKDLLVSLRMIDGKEKAIWPPAKKAGLYGVIDALESKGNVIKTTRGELMASLSIYLNLGVTRGKNGYSSIQTSVKKDAISFLNQPVRVKK